MRINDFWNVDGDHTLSGSWARLTKFTLLNEKFARFVCSVERQRKIQATTRLDYLSYGMWKEKEEQHWAVEKTKFDTARKLRRI